MANVAAKASCCGGGRKAGVGVAEVVPEVSNEISRWSAGTSKYSSQGVHILSSLETNKDFLPNR